MCVYSFSKVLEAEEDIIVYKLVGYNEVNNVLVSLHAPGGRIKQYGFEDPGQMVFYHPDVLMESPLDSTPGFYCFVDFESAWQKGKLWYADMWHSHHPYTAIIAVRIPKGSRYFKACSRDYGQSRYDCILAEFITMEPYVSLVQGE
jgi:hypothetical protein